MEGGSGGCVHGLNGNFPSPLPGLCDLKLLASTGCASLHPWLQPGGPSGRVRAASQGETRVIRVARFSLCCFSLFALRFATRYPAIPRRRFAANAPTIASPTAPAHAALVMGTITSVAIVGPPVSVNVMRWPLGESVKLRAMFIV
jgi:hypothetical protein